MPLYTIMLLILFYQMAKGNKKPNKSKTKKPKKLKPFERPSEGNPDSAAQTPDVYYNNGPGKHGRKEGSVRRVPPQLQFRT